MMSAQELANGISYSGHMYAMTRAGRHLTPAGDLQETFGGMEQVLYSTYMYEYPNLSLLLFSFTVNCPTNISCLKCNQNYI